jgi:hypothetical protein
MTADVMVIDISRSIETVVGFGIIFIFLLVPFIFKNWVYRMEVKYGDKGIIFMIILIILGCCVGMIIALWETFPKIEWVW